MNSNAATGPDSLLLEAIENEQRAIADELHDTFSQSLSGAAMIVQTLMRTAESGGVVPIEQFETLKRLIDETIDRTRVFVTCLNPGDLQGAGLMNALEQLATHFSVVRPCEFHCEKAVFISGSDLALTFYRITQEICHCALRSNAVDRLKISFFSDPDLITLAVTVIGSRADFELSELVRRRAQLAGIQLKTIPEAEGKTLICSIARNG